MLVPDVWISLIAAGGRIRLFKGGGDGQLSPVLSLVVVRARLVSQSPFSDAQVDRTRAPEHEGGSIT